MQIKTSRLFLLIKLPGILQMVLLPVKWGKMVLSMYSVVSVVVKFNPAATLYIIQDRNGLIYWNTTMPMLKDSLNLDTLQAHGQLIGWYSDGPNPGDTLVGTPQAYRVGLTSFPCISIADNGDMYVIWSGITWQNPDPSGLGNYRHIWGRGFNYAAQMWTTNQIDFNSDISYIFQ
jgi:hypothetical protein